MRAIFNHVRHNVIAYLALFVALGGTSYAAITIPNGSVTARKLDKHSIGGYVLAWAHVRSDGHVLSGSPGAVATYLSELAGESPAGANYLVGWRAVRVPDRCAAITTLDENGPLSSRSATSEAYIYPKWSFVRPAVRTHGQARIDIANASDQNVPDNFYVAVVC